MLHHSICPAHFTTSNQDGLGDGTCRAPYSSTRLNFYQGWMYTIFAVILLFGSAAVLLTIKKGEEWRTKAEASEKKS